MSVKYARSWIKEKLIIYLWQWPLYNFFLSSKVANISASGPLKCFWYSRIFLPMNVVSILHVWIYVLCIYKYKGAIQLEYFQEVTGLQFFFLPNKVMKSTSLRVAEAVKYEICHSFQKQEENRAALGYYLSSSQIQNIVHDQTSAPDWILLEIRFQKLQFQGQHHEAPETTNQHQKVGWPWNKQKFRKGHSMSSLVFANIPQFLQLDSQQFAYIHPQYSPMMVPTAFGTQLN